MRFTGVFRVYFNRHGAEPLMWCIAMDSRATSSVRCEIAVPSVVITAPCATVYRKKETADEDDGKPSAWIETAGLLVIDEYGIATIRPATEA